MAGRGRSGPVRRPLPELGGSESRSAILTLSSKTARPRAEEAGPVEPLEARLFRREAERLRGGGGGVGTRLGGMNALGV